MDHSHQFVEKFISNQYFVGKKHSNKSVFYFIFIISYIYVKLADPTAVSRARQKIS